MDDKLLNGHERVQNVENEENNLKEMQLSGLQRVGLMKGLMKGLMERRGKKTVLRCASRTIGAHFRKKQAAEGRL